MRHPSGMEVKQFSVAEPTDTHRSAQVTAGPARRRPNVGHRSRVGLAMRVALFVTCLNDTLFPDVGRATVRVLERLGVTVDFPLAQTCCGQMHFNSGYPDACLPMLRQFVRAFADYDLVVTPSGSCAAMVRQHHPRLARRAVGPDARSLVEEIDLLVPRVVELTEALVDVLGVEDCGASFPHRVTYHSTCHSLRLLDIGDRPLRLLRAVRGLELVDLEGADQCCGFGGTFALKNPEVSTAMGTDKLHAVLRTDAEVLTAGDSSCLMHLGGLLHRAQAGIEVRHLAEILAAEERAR